MDRRLRLEGAEHSIQSIFARDIHPLKIEMRDLLQDFQPGALEGYIVIVIQIVDSDNVVSSLE